MLRAQGQGTWVDPDLGNELLVRDSIRCGHCSKAVFVKPGTASTVYLIQHLDMESKRMWWTEEPGAFCRCCMRPVCLPCDDKGTCTPLEAFLEEMETGKRRLVQV